MRRLVVLATFLLAALAAGVTLWPAWSDRADGPPRARSRLDAPARTGSAAGDTTHATPPARADGEGDHAQSRVRGVVTGRMGGLWGARVVAYRSGSGEVLTETHTNPDGIYSLPVEPDVTFDLAVEPMDITGLLPSRLHGLAVASGRERQEDVALAEAPTFRGRVVDEDGTGHRIGIVAVPTGDIRDLSTLPEVPAELVAARTTAGGHGWFRLQGLAPGSYELVVEDPEWMFPEPVVVRTDGPEPSLPIVPALTLDLRVKDAETDEPVAAFAVRARIGDRVLLEAEGRDGAFSRRTRWPGPRQWPYHVLVEVTASDLVAPAPFTASERARPVWLWPEREPNTTVRISFDDGTLYRGTLVAHFKSKTGLATGSVSFDRDRDGAYHAALPWGQWDLTLMARLYNNWRHEAEAAVSDNRNATLDLVLPAGGALRLFPPPGVDMSEARIRKVVEDGERESEVMVTVPRDGALVEGIPPGAYEVGCCRETLYDGTSYRTTHWFRDVRVVTGSTEEIQLPPP